RRAGPRRRPDTRAWRRRVGDPLPRGPGASRRDRRLAALLGRVRGPRKLEHGLALELFLLLDRALELRSKTVHVLVGSLVARLCMPEMRANLVEVVGEPREVALEVGEVRHHLGSLLLALH